MTLVSRPVLAAVTSGQCTTPSGFVSLNASNAGRGVSCSGRTAAYWADPLNFNQWPSGFRAENGGGGPATNFSGPPNGVFAPVPPFFNSGNGNPIPHPTLLEVLNGTATTHDATTDSVAKAVSAAVLNAAAGLAPVLSVQLVKDIWAEYGQTGFGAGGTFSPASGATWNVTEILDYLSTTLLT